MKARKTKPFDGTESAGKPIGDWLDVIKIEDHGPVDGNFMPACVCHLSDGSWEFKWNLYFDTFEKKLDELPKNNLDEILDIAATAKKIRKSWGYK